MKEFLKTLPKSPGCYLMKDSEGNIIYVGKSKCLKNRVTSYFQGIDKKEGKIQKLVYHIASIEIMETVSELDALILECCLIKKYNPEYNTLLKANKRYPYIEIQKNMDYPRFTITNSIEAKKNIKYFGCFYSYYDALDVINLINSVWKLPSCNNKKSTRACLNYHMGKCFAPCERLIDKKEYMETVNEAIDFLEGSKNKLIKLKKEMKTASGLLEFEQAAVIRDRLRELSRLSSRIERFNVLFENNNVFVFMRPYNEEECFSLFHILNGRLIGCMNFLNKNKEEFADKIAYFDDSPYNENGSLCIEPWICKIEEYLQTSGTLSEKLPQFIAQIGANKLFVTIKKRTHKKGVRKILLRKFDLFFARRETI